MTTHPMQTESITQAHLTALVNYANRNGLYRLTLDKTNQLTTFPVITDTALLEKGIALYLPLRDDMQRETFATNQLSEVALSHNPLTQTTNVQYSQPLDTGVQTETIAVPLTKTQMSGFVNDTLYFEAICEAEDISQIDIGHVHNLCVDYPTIMSRWTHFKYSLVNTLVDNVTKHGITSWDLTPWQSACARDAVILDNSRTDLNVPVVAVYSKYSTLRDQSPVPQASTVIIDDAMMCHPKRYQPFMAMS